jgi:hypothetical protein
MIQRLDKRRYAVSGDGLVRFVGTQEECQSRVDPKEGPVGPRQSIGAVDTAHALSRASARSSLPPVAVLNVRGASSFFGLLGVRRGSPPAQRFL